MIVKNDIKILRMLARKYLECANDEHNAKCIKLHRAVNDLQMIRPVVLIDELPWHEMDMDKELTLQCEDRFLKEIEEYMRQTIYKFKYLRADMIIRPYIPIKKIINSSGIGVDVQEHVLHTSTQNNISSHDYKDQFRGMDDLEKLHSAEITYNQEKTNLCFNLLGDIIGDIIPIKKIGKNHVFMNPWDDIARFRGVTPLLIDIMEEPELSHALIKKLTDIYMDIDDQYLKLGLFDTEPNSLHSTAILNSTLHPEKDNCDYKNIWGRGTAQIFASVSKAMHEEFDIEYMKTAIGRCGLVYYGCCEPLDKKIDIVEKIPNLRKISITPWADISIAAEAINKRFAVALKPNPAFVATAALDEETVKKEITEKLNACKKNNCSCDIVLKDISTCNYNPENIFKWEKIVMDLVKNY